MCNLVERKGGNVAECLLGWVRSSSAHSEIDGVITNLKTRHLAQEQDSVLQQGSPHQHTL